MTMHFVNTHTAPGNQSVEEKEETKLMRVRQFQQQIPKLLSQITRPINARLYNYFLLFHDKKSEQKNSKSGVHFLRT